VLSASKWQLDWLNLPHSPTLPSLVTAKHQVVKFQKMSDKNVAIKACTADDTDYVLLWTNIQQNGKVLINITKFSIPISKSLPNVIDVKPE